MPARPRAQGARRGRRRRACRGAGRPAAGATTIRRSALLPVTCSALSRPHISHDRRARLAPPAGWGLHLDPTAIPKGFQPIRPPPVAADRAKTTMPARKILVVDDDDVLRDSLVEQLSLYEEFDIAQEATAAKGVQRARAEPRRPRHHGRRPARHGRARGGQAPAQGRLQGAGDHADRPGFGIRHDPRPRGRRQRLRHQAVPLRRAARPHPRPAPPARAERGRGLHHRPLHVPAERQDAGRRAAARRSG